MVNATLLSFADTRLTRTARRFRKQASRMGLFENIQIESEQRLDPAFLNHFQHVMSPENRGFGFFCWKPQIILEKLQNSNDGDIVVYLDVGSHLFTKHSQTLEKYIRLCAASDSGILAFQTEFKEKFWTKGDLFDHLQARNLPEISDSGQVQAGFIIIRNSDTTRKFVSRWLKLFWQNLNLLDDSISKTPNFPGFLQNRHDQSAFSLLAKISGATLLPAAGQTAQMFSASCLRRSSLPVLHLRDLTTDTDRTLISRVRFYSKPLQDCAYRRARRVFAT